ncbi:MAG: tetratricopeptide repeat protein [Phycisphaera sp.]|nr:tetratricopeptide repeat protein [Phycisphaera sp.]
MAKRVNTRFVMLLAAAIAVLTLAAVGIYVVLQQSDPTDNVARGMEYYADGQYRLAAQQFGRALYKRQNDASLMLRFVDCVEHYDSKTIEDAQKNLVETQKYLRQAVEVDPSSVDVLDRYMKSLYEIGYRLNDNGAWDQMYAKANNLASSRPDLKLAAKYRGIATAYRVSTVNVVEQDIEQATTDLADWVKDHPDDRVAVYALALLRVNKGQAMLRAGSLPATVEPIYEQARELLRNASAAHPEDIGRKLDLLRIELVTSDIESARKTIKELAKLVPANASQAEDMAVAAQLIPTIFSESGAGAESKLTPEQLALGESMIDAALKIKPGNPSLLLLKAMLLRSTADREDTIKTLTTAAEAQVIGSPLDSVIQFNSQAGARVMAAEMLIASAQTQTDTAQRDELLKRSQGFIDLSRSVAGQTNPGIQIVQGKLYAAQGQWGQVMATVEPADEQLNHRNPDAALLLANASSQLGQSGSAVQYLQRVLSIRPELVQVRMELARQYLRAKQFAEARAEAERVLATEPKNTDAMILQASAIGSQGDMDRAVTILRGAGINEDSPSQAVILLVRMMFSAGQTDKAKALLSAAFEKKPTDVVLLQSYVQLMGDDKPLVLAAIEKARAAGVSEQLTSYLTKQVQNPDEARQNIEDLVAQQSDPFQKELVLYRLAVQSNDYEKANGHLLAAEKLQPDSDIVINLRYEDALRRKAFDEAMQLANRAGDKNMDLAKGDFMRGRVMLLKGDYPEAITTFRRALTSRNNFSEGWQMIGDAYRLNGNATDAATAYNRAVDQRPDNSGALQGLTGVYLSQRNYDKALECARRLIQLLPDEPGARALYLQLEEQFGDAGRARNLRESLARQSPTDYDNRRALVLSDLRDGKTDQAMKRIDQVIADEGQTVQNAVVKATVMSRAGKAQEAQEMLKGFVQSKGDKATMQDWLLVARYFVGTNQVDQGMAAFRLAIALEDPKTKDATREMADTLFNLGSYEDAIKAYEPMWDADNSDARVGLRIVEGYIKLNKPDEARRVLAKIKPQKGTEYNYHLVKYMMARLDQKPGEALSETNLAIQADPNQSMAYAFRASVQMDDPTKEREVTNDLDTAIRLDPTNGIARNLKADQLISVGRQSAAANELESYLRVNPEDTRTRRRLVSMYFSARDWTRLDALLAESASQFPTDATWPMFQAQMADQRRGPNDAKLKAEKLEMVMRLAPSQETLYQWCRALLAIKKADAVLNILRDQAAAMRGQPLLEALRARALNDRGDKELAKGAFRAALASCQNYTQVGSVVDEAYLAYGIDQVGPTLRSLAEADKLNLIELHLARLDISQGRYKQAMDNLRSLDSALPQQADERAAYDQLIAMAAQMSGDNATAEAAYRRLIKRTPEDAQSLNNLAYLLVEDGRAKEAVPMAEKALAVAGNDVQVLDTLGWVYFKAGNTEKARATLEKSVGTARLPDNCYHYAQVLASSGEVGSAVEWFNIALDLSERAGNKALSQTITDRLREISSNPPEPTR